MPDSRSNSLRTRVAEISLRSDGILYMNFTDDEVVTLQDRIDIVEACKSLVGDKMYPVIIKTGDRIKITEEARKYDMNAAVEKFVIREALVINSLSTRISAHFYYKLRKPNFEVKVFSKIEEAEKWIKKASEIDAAQTGTN